MNFHKDAGDSLEPCRHMESMLNRTAEGSAPWLMKWYAKSHAARCGRCGRFLSNLSGLLMNLRGIKEVGPGSEHDDHLSHERWETVEKSWAEVEKSRP